jgi:anaerobic selenocysteine-containing dehydrogenase
VDPLSKLRIGVEWMLFRRGLGVTNHSESGGFIRSNKQGGTAPDQNVFGVELSQQQPAEIAAWYAPSMCKIVKQGGRRHRKGRSWIAEPKEGGARRRTMFACLIWGNDNYRTNGALVNLALATGNIGREGGGCVRMGGHQEGYAGRPTPSSAGRRPASTSC